MIHWLVAGESGSGKSASMMTAVAPSWLDPVRFRLPRQPRAVLVLDPQLKSGWLGACTWITADPDEWLAALKRSRSCVGIWDEAGNTIESDPKLGQRLSWVPMQSRNLGHLVYFIGNRAGQLPIGYQNQCGSALIFHQRSDYDRRRLSQLYGPEMMTANTLDIGECLIARPMKSPVKTRLFRIK